MRDDVWAAELHGVGDVRLARRPCPEPGPGEALVRVTAVGLCGSDLHWYGDGGIGDVRLDAPVVPGHEFAGVVEGGALDGRRVACDPAVPCETCVTCHAGHRNLCPTVGFAGHGTRDGALQEYLVWPERLLFPLSDALSDVDGALLEPLGVALHAVDLGHVRLGATVAVVGCGPIGLLLVQAVRCAGATTVLAVDPLPHRREAAARLGADHTLADGSDPVTWREAAGWGVDVAFEVAGTDGGVEAAVQAARPGARVVLVGIPAGDRTSFPASPARRKGLSLVLSRRMDDAYPRAAGLAARGLVDLASVVSAHYPLAEAATAFTRAASRDGLKVVVEPSR